MKSVAVFYLKVWRFRAMLQYISNEDHIQSLIPLQTSPSSDKMKNSSCSFLTAPNNNSPSIQYTTHPAGSQETWRLAQETRGTRQGRAWAGGQSITGHNHTQYMLFRDAYNTCLWTCGNKRNWRKPPRHKENMQTPHLWRFEAISNHQDTLLLL